jgi:hypothetical protein
MLWLWCSSIKLPLPWFLNDWIWIPQPERSVRNSRTDSTKLFSNATEADWFERLKLSLLILFNQKDFLTVFPFSDVQSFPFHSREFQQLGNRANFISKLEAEILFWTHRPALAPVWLSDVLSKSWQFVEIWSIQSSCALENRKGRRWHENQFQHREWRRWTEFVTFAWFDSIFDCRWCEPNKFILLSSGNWSNHHFKGVASMDQILGKGFYNQCLWISARNPEDSPIKFLEPPTFAVFHKKFSFIHPASSEKTFRK